MARSDDNHVQLKVYFDTRFDDLKMFIDEKFKVLEKRDDHLEKVVGQLEKRVSRLEKWRAYICGAFVVIGFLIKLFYDMVVM